jgi:CarD family transcriptional regulator
LVELPFYNDDEFAELHRLATGASGEKKSWFDETPESPEPQSDAVNEAEGFSVGEKVIYPARGVGEILAIERQEIAGARLELFVINFIKHKMTLRVPTAKLVNVGMRKLSEPSTVSRALVHVADPPTGRWRRNFQPQEAEAKINSGDIFAIADVVRELHPTALGYEPSYSERQLTKLRSTG